jgi:hypothetical protein
MSLPRSLTAPLLPSPWPSFVVIIWPVGPGFLLRLTD